jgi:hypothetical protein
MAATMKRDNNGGARRPTRRLVPPRRLSRVVVVFLAAAVAVVVVVDGFRLALVLPPSPIGTATARRHGGSSSSVSLSPGQNHYHHHVLAATRTTRPTTKMEFTIEDFLPPVPSGGGPEEEMEKKVKKDMKKPTRIKKKAVSVADTLEEELEAEEEQDSEMMRRRTEVEEVEAPPVEEEEDETETFLRLIEDTPPGRLQSSEITVMKELLLDEAMADMEVVLERLLFRLVDEWEAVTRRTRSDDDDNDDESLLLPTTEMALRAMRAWQNRILASGTTNYNNSRKVNTDILPIATDHVLDIYERLYETERTSGRPPNTSSTELAELALETLCLSRRRGVLKQVEGILRRYDRSSRSLKMMEYHILALARDGKPQAAERLLRQERHLTIAIDTLNSILTGYAKSATPSAGRGGGRRDDRNNDAAADDSSEIAEQLVVYMTDERNLSPNAATFTCLMDCYAQQRNWYAAERCQAILDQMLALNDPALSPNIVAWTSVMSTWGKLKRPDAAEKVNALMARVQQRFAPAEIDAHAYVTWMRANAWSGTTEGLVQAEAIMQEMQELYLDGIGDESFQPTPAMVRTLVDAWLQSDAPRKVVEASRVADRYERVLATAPELYGLVWRNLLSGWCAYARNPVHAETYLDRLIEREDLTAALDASCFDKIIDMNTYINDANSMARSVSLFDRMEACRLAGRVQPTERVYTTFIKAMVKARAPQLLRKVTALVRRMHELYESNNADSMRPTIFTYNAVLAACAAIGEYDDDENDKDRDEALALAVRTLHTIRSEYIETMDSTTLSRLLQCAVLLRRPDDGNKRTQWLASTFRLACEHGLVNTVVLADFQQLAPIELWRKTFRGIVDDEVVVDESILPPAWTQNVRRSRRSSANADDARGSGGQRFRPDGGGGGGGGGGNFRGRR